MLKEIEETGQCNAMQCNMCVCVCVCVSYEEVTLKWLRKKFQTVFSMLLYVCGYFKI